MVLSQKKTVFFCHINVFSLFVHYLLFECSPHNFFDTFCGHFLWTLLMKLLVDSLFGHFLWTLILETFGGQFLPTFLVDP